MAVFGHELVGLFRGVRLSGCFDDDCGNGAGIAVGCCAFVAPDPQDQCDFIRLDDARNCSERAHYLLVFCRRCGGSGRLSFSIN